MRKWVFLLVLFTTLVSTADAANVVFRASAPQAVAMGENFRISYTVNAEGKDLRVPELSAFDVLYGPTTSNSMSTQIINGSMTSEVSMDLIGSVTGEVIEANSVPVLAVPENFPFNDLAKVQNIAFATSFNQRDLLAFDEFMQIMKPYKAHIHLFNISTSHELQISDGLLYYIEI